MNPLESGANPTLHPNLEDDMTTMLTIEARNKVMAEFMANNLNYVEAKHRLMGLGMEKSEVETALEVARAGHYIKL